MTKLKSYADMLLETIESQEEGFRTFLTAVKAEAYRSKEREKIVRELVEEYTPDASDEVIAHLEQRVEDVASVAFAKNSSANAYDEQDAIADTLATSDDSFSKNDEEESKSSRTQEDFHDMFSPESFPFQEVWKKLTNEEKQAFMMQVSDLANGKLAQEELQTIDFLATVPKFVIEEAMEEIASTGGDALSFQASVDSLAQKGLVTVAGKLHNLVFLTRLGIWFYCLVRKNSPIIYWDSVWGRYTYQISV